ncbi:MAG TPA: ComEC/Rec2 family competence protein [Candidatus Dormibacteraeota bacterium]|nr:ComEC/Rec2 family competence protein [Candidatus Dormibacteraeota bacterium]
MTRYPALVLAVAWCVAIAAAVVLVPMQPIFGVAALAAAVPAVALALFLRPALIALGLTVALLAVARTELPAVDPLTPSRAAAYAGDTVVMTGRVADDSRAVGRGAEVLVEPQQLLDTTASIVGVGNLIVRWRGPSQPTAGDIVTASGKLTLPRDLPAFDRRAYLAQRHVYLELQASSLDVTTNAGGLAMLPGWLRARLTAALDAALPAPHAAILLGVVLGIKQGIPPRLQNALIATGLVHLLVLSGLKVAVFARIVEGALRPILGRGATWPAIALVSLYAMTGGATPAAVRASAMGALAIAGAHLGRPSHVWTSLALTAAAMLAWRPEVAWDVGFQLSFAGTAAIILLTPGIARHVAFLPPVLREPFAVTCAAQIGTLPMMATDFHVFSPAAPIANALTLPILPVAVAAGLLLGALGIVPELAHVAAIPITALVAYIEQVAYQLARVPLAVIPIPHFPAWMGAAYYSALGPAIAGAHARGRTTRRMAIITAGVAPLLITCVAVGMWINAPPQAVVMNVGDGQAVLLRSARGTILIDGGPSPARLSDELGAQLPPWQRTIDALVITAPGLGHVGGLAGFERPAALVFIPAADLSGSSWRAAALEEAGRGARVASLAAGQTVDVAGFHLEALAPERGAPGDQVGAADLALEVRAPDGKTFCDFSDLDLDAQTIAATRIDAPCTYLLLPNGGKSTLSPDLERAAMTSTTQLVASRGSGRLAAGFPPNVLRTDQEGPIAVPL